MLSNHSNFCHRSSRAYGGLLAYSMGYTPTNTRKEGKRRKIQVKALLGDQIDPKLIVVQHRQSYVEEGGKK